MAKNNTQTADAQAAAQTADAQAAAQTEADTRVEVYIPRGAERDEANLFVSVNGKSYLLPKGKTSLVPPEIAAEIKRANKAQETLDTRKDELLNASKQPKN